jgi:polysaccharide pyruvyl transferase WcaK-like protein
VELIAAAGGGRELAIVAPPLKPGQRAGWRGTVKRAPGLTLHEWDPALPTLRSDGAAPSIELVDDLLGTPRVAEALRAAAGVAGAPRVYYGGGEHLFARGDPGEDWAVAGRLLPLLAAHRAGARVMCLPATFGPLESPFARELVSRFAAASSVLLARDTVSLRELAGLGIQAAAGADPALFLPMSARARPLFRSEPLRVALVMRLESTGLRAGAPRSRAVLRQLRRDGWQASAAYRAFLGLGRDLLAAGHEVRVLVQAGADRDPARALVAELGGEGEQLQLVEPGSLDQYVRALSFCQAVLTARFHSAIFALLCGSVPIGLHFKGHGPKLPGLLELIGEPGLAIACDDGGHEGVVEALERARADRPRLGAELAGRADELRAATLERVATAVQERGQNPFLAQEG